MSTIAANSRKHAHEHTASPGGAIDPRLARLVLQMCLRKQAQRLRPAAPRNYVPRMDLYDDRNMPHVTAMLELPGVRRENMSVVVRDGKLLVTGERTSPLAARIHQSTRHARTKQSMAGSGDATSPQTEIDPTNYRFRELKFGRFHREIDIPIGTQTDDVIAEMSDGMLLLSWPRALAPTARTRSAAPSPSTL